VARYVAVPLKFTAGVRQSRLGIVDDIRRAVQGARRAHPGLARSQLAEITLKRRGKELLVTLYFTG
jgi:hypothetical protein